MKHYNEYIQSDYGFITYLYIEPLMMSSSVTSSLNLLCLFSIPTSANAHKMFKPLSLHRTLVAPSVLLLAMRRNAVSAIVCVLRDHFVSSGVVGAMCSNKNAQICYLIKKYIM